MRSKLQLVLVLAPKKTEQLLMEQELVPLALVEVMAHLKEPEKTKMNSLSPQNLLINKTN